MTGLFPQAIFEGTAPTPTMMKDVTMMLLVAMFALTTYTALAASLYRWASGGGES